jgi:hypothetical protein
MPVNLWVNSITFPPPVASPCPTRVDVVLQNRGTETPRLKPGETVFYVKLQCPVPPAKVISFEPSELPVVPESLGPGKQLTLSFTIRFTLPGPTFAQAIPDSGSVIINWLPPRQSPPLIVPVSVDAVAWLWTQIDDIAIEDSSGRDYSALGTSRLCAGSTLVVKAAVTNNGKATAQPSQTELTLSDTSGTVLAVVDQWTSMILPSVRQPVVFKGTVPKPATGTQLKIQVCADVTQAVTPQCDRSHLCFLAAPFDVVTSAVAPRARLTASPASIAPGQSVRLTWELQNGCADLIDVVAAISYKGTVLNSPSPVPVGPFEFKTGDFDLASSNLNLPKDFYTLNQRNLLELAVTASGKDPGPYRDSTQVSVKSTVTGGWWTWTSPPQGTAFKWKEETYALLGALINHGFATATPQALTLMQQEPGGPRTRAPVAAPPVVPILPGAGEPATWPGLSQAWRWTGPPLWTLDGPASKNFLYTVDFSLLDEFNNSYPTQTSPPLRIKVAVSFSKDACRITAEVNVGLAALATACGLLALATGAIATAVQYFASAAGLLLVSTTFGNLALDPPVPDFRYDEVLPVVPPERRPDSEEVPHSLATLSPIAELLSRIVRAIEVLGPTEARLLAARIDNNAAAIDRQAANYRNAVRILEMAASALPGAANEAALAIEEAGDLPPDERVQETLASVQRKGVPADARTLWIRSNLPEESLVRLEAVMREIKLPLPPFTALLREAMQALLRATDAIAARMPTVLADGEGFVAPGEAPG